MSKVLEVIVTSRLTAQIETNGKLSVYQSGFRAGRGVLDNHFILNECIAHSREQRRPLFMAFLDVEKAYDRTWRDGLTYRLIRLGLSPKLIRLVRQTYANVSRAVVVNQGISPIVLLLAGVPQGAVSSPLLYDVFIDPLLHELHDAQYGVTVCGLRIPVLAYADDLVLLASSQYELQRMLDHVSLFAELNQFNFNNSKSAVVVVGSRHIIDSADQMQFVLGGLPLAMSPTYKYLGLEIGRPPTGSKWAAAVDQLVRTSRGMAARVGYVCGYKHGVSANVQAKLFSSLISPVYEFGCPIWGPEIPDTLLRSIDTVQTRFGRQALSCGRGSHNSFVRGELGLRTARSRIDELALRFFGRLAMSLHPIIGELFSRRLRQARRFHASPRFGQHGARGWCASVRAIFARYDMLDTWRSGMLPADTTLNQWDCHCRRVTLAHELTEWRQTLRTAPTLWSLYARIKQYPRTETFVDDYLNKRGCELKLQLRSGVMRLNSFVARLSQLPRGDPGYHCRMCTAGAVEDAEHFLLRCPAFRSHRVRLFDVISERLSDTVFRDVVPRITALPGDELMCVLAGGTDCTPSDPPLNDSLSNVTVQTVIDRAFRNFLLVAWRARAAVCGRTVFDLRKKRGLKI